jgi:hypothetical protein
VELFCSSACCSFASLLHHLFQSAIRHHLGIGLKEKVPDSVKREIYVVIFSISLPTFSTPLWLYVTDEHNSGVLSSQSQAALHMLSHHYTAA